VDHWLGWAHSSHMHGWDRDLTGYVASVLVLITFCMKSIRSLRLIAMVSNVAFIVYAVSTDMRPILILHSILLPVNVVRLMQIEFERIRQRRSHGSPAKQSSADDPLGDHIGRRSGAVT